METPLRTRFVKRIGAALGMVALLTLALVGAVAGSWQASSQDSAPRAAAPAGASAVVAGPAARARMPRATHSKTAARPTRQRPARIRPLRTARGRVGGTAASPARKAHAKRARALASDVSVTLCAKAGTTTLPGGIDVNIWGFASSCSEPAGLPGPVIVVNVDDVVTISLENQLAGAVALSFPGLSIVPDQVGAAPGGTKTYTFRATRPGTFLYGAGGAQAARQVAMGLYGALIVRSTTPNQAYGTAASAYTPGRENVLVLSEIDPALNGVVPNPPNATFNFLDYAPKYWLINGKAYPAAPVISAAAGDRVLLRYVNASLEHHTMELLGDYQTVVAKDAFATQYPIDLVAETIPAGQTADMIVAVPSTAASGTRYALFSRQLHVTNGPVYPGGMLTFIAVP